MAVGALPRNVRHTSGYIHDIITTIIAAGKEHSAGVVDGSRSSSSSSSSSNHDQHGSNSNSNSNSNNSIKNYGEQVILTTIYLSTELVMIKDTSNNFKDTWTYLNNRISEIERLENGATNQNPSDVLVATTAAATAIGGVVLSLLGPKTVGLFSTIGNHVGGLSNHYDNGGSSSSSSSSGSNVSEDFGGAIKKDAFDDADDGWVLEEEEKSVNGDVLFPK
jgi:hypothetical protein